MTNFIKHKSCLLFLNPVLSDTLLNVFLAIAVDNLANAQELTKVKHNFSVSDSPFISPQNNLAHFLYAMQWLTAVNAVLFFYFLG